MDYKEEVKMIKALADENRLAILDFLQYGEKCGCEILEKLDITQPTLSYHMKVLCDNGIVDSCRDGKWMHYFISVEGSKKYRNMIGKYTLDEVKASEYKKCANCN